MPFVTAQDHRLLISDAPPASSRAGNFRTGLDALDALLPGGAWPRGAVHELLHDPRHPVPMFAAATIAGAAAWRRSRIANRELRIGKTTDARLAFASIRDSKFEIRDSATQSAIAFLDPHHRLYPPALVRLGLSLDRVWIVRPRTRDDLVWATAECLKCAGLSAVVAPIEGRLSRTEVRKLQLAAEQGRSTAVLLRADDRHAQLYAAATRWRVAPARGDRLVQRWELTLIHGHGGHLNASVHLEHHRETGTVHAVQGVQAVRAAQGIEGRRAGVASGDRAVALPRGAVVETRALHPPAPLADRPREPQAPARSA